MEMIIRWFGEDYDSVKPEYIRQIPGVTGVASTLMGKQAGEEWQPEEIAQLCQRADAAGLTVPVIESVNIHDDIKLGLPSRAEYIERYVRTLRALAEAGVHVVCYNFMPMFDWMRTALAYPLPDGSNTMAYSQQQYEALGGPEEIAKRIAGGSGGHALPGWEPERLADIQRLFKAYEGITTAQLHRNLQYFLQAVIPVCEEVGIKMAIHPDDPPWEIYGLSRVFANEEDAAAILGLYSSKYNCLTMCTGSLGVHPQADLVPIIRRFGSHIPFAHVRNFKRTAEREFYESSHPSAEGSLDMYAIVKTLHDHAPECYIRPDHGRMIWGEEGRPGYGLYDRALGAAYIQGLWEAIDKGAHNAAE